MSERSEALAVRICDGDTPMQKVIHRKEIIAIRRTNRNIVTVFFALRGFALFWGE